MSSCVLSKTSFYRFKQAFQILNERSILCLLLLDEWNNFLERIGRGESTGDVELQENSCDSLELRFWVSYRGQTLARTGNINRSCHPLGACMSELNLYTCTYNQFVLFLSFPNGCSAWYDVL